MDTLGCKWEKLNSKLALLWNKISCITYFGRPRMDCTWRCVRFSARMVPLELCLDFLGLTSPFGYVGFISNGLSCLGSGRATASPILTFIPRGHNGCWTDCHGIKWACLSQSSSFCGSLVSKEYFITRYTYQANVGCVLVLRSIQGSPTPTPRRLKMEYSVPKQIKMHYQKKRKWTPGGLQC